MAVEISKRNKTIESTTAQYQDLDVRTTESPRQYQELVKTPETTVKLVTDKPDITYENTKVQTRNNSGTKYQNEPSQYEELNTRNEKNEEVSLR